MTPTSAFKTSEGEAEFLAAYDAAMKLWPVPYEEIDIPGQFGMTHLVTTGPKDAPPLLLLHGYMNTLTIWLRYIADFSKDYRVYAIDVMGQPGKSVPDEPVRDAADYVTWLSATLDGLNLDRIFLAGISFGGWIALGFALTAPQRVRKLVLLSPAASFKPLVRQFALRGLLSGIIPTRRTMDSFMKWMGMEAAPGDPDIGRALELMWLGGKNFQWSPETRRVMPDVFSDDELRALQVPVLLLIGENEVIYDPAAALARARQLIPNLEGELVPQCSHDMCFSQHRFVAARVLEFLNDN